CGSGWARSLADADGNRGDLDPTDDADDCTCVSRVGQRARATRAYACPTPRCPRGPAWGEAPALASPVAWGSSGATLGFGDTDIASDCDGARCGNVKAKREPLPSWLSTASSPPLRSTSSLHRMRPSPVPVSPLVPTVERSGPKSNRRERRLSAMPTPVSPTEI